jgi:hypothetical protein
MLGVVMAWLRELQGLLIPDWVLFYLAFMAELAFSKTTDSKVLV